MLFKNSEKKLYSKIRACWLGKSIGGTLGLPYEMQDGPFNLTFYDPVPTKMLANDDLDLQVVWAVVMSKMKEVKVDRYVLAKAWQDHVRFPFDEYAIALKNLALGIKPPVSGRYDNWFAGSMGAVIRSEIWACLAPGKPEIAALYAYEDACVDHDGDGIWAEIFMASLESMAFIENDLKILFENSLGNISVQSVLYKAVIDTMTWWEDSYMWRVVRGQILEKYGVENFSDVTMNVCFIVLALLAGKGDFGKTICIAANCGKDTDCTAATAGAIMGILNPSGITEKWLKPIGNSIVVSPEIVGVAAPKTIEAFTEMVIDIRKRLSCKPPQVEEIFTDTAKYAIPVEMGFVDRVEGLGFSANAPIPTMPDDSQIIELPGNLASMDTSEFQNEVVLLKYKAYIDKPGIYNIMLNTKENCRVWIDGSRAFGRESGIMTPSPHRKILNQFIEINLDSGVHEMLVAIKKPEKTRTIEWVIAVADGDTYLWVPEAFMIK